MKISEILHLAADRYLWDGVNHDDTSAEFSCYAIYDAIYFTENQNMKEAIDVGLTNMGLCTYLGYSFDEFEEGEDRQYARYLWLKFAAMIAEEQGV